MQSSRDWISSSGYSLRDLIQSSFYPNTCCEEVEKMLTSVGRNGSFLLWLRNHVNGCHHYILSAMSNQRIIHMKMQCINGYHNMCGEEEFKSPYDVILNCMENPSILKEKNGSIIELKQPVTNDKKPTRWYHIYPKEAERALSEKGKYGSYLVRPSFTQPGDYVLCVRLLQDEIVRVKIYGNGDEKFDVVKNGKQFSSIDDLISHYKKYPLKTDKGTVITLDQGVDNDSETMGSTDCCDIGTKLASRSTIAQSTKKYSKALFQDAPTSVSIVNLLAGYDASSTKGVVQYVKANGKCTLSLNGTLTDNNSLFKEHRETVTNEHGSPIGEIRYYECFHADGYYMCWHDNSTVDCELKKPDTLDCHYFKWEANLLKNNDKKDNPDQLQYYNIIALNFKGPDITGCLTFREGTDDPPTIQTVNATKFKIYYRNQTK